MTYEEKITLLNGDDFFSLFEFLHAEPRWVNSAGKKSIQIIGLCHHGDNHSALFDPTTLKVNCFSECGGGMLLHTWVKRALGLEDPQLAKDFIEDWLDGKKIDLTGRVPIRADFGFTERPFELTHIDPEPGIPQDIIEEIYSHFDETPETLNRLVWHTKEGISLEMLQLYRIAYYPDKGSIILPHHNIDGEIVGIYERSFKPLRRDFHKMFPDVPYSQLMDLPRAKYVPLLRDEQYRDEEKTSWSFSNSKNLYGLHLAKEEIARTGEAIIFEGGKSVMLARQWGFKNAVASHTFGCHTNHINMLWECGARTIYLAFDKQYHEMSEDDKEWVLYEKRTKGMAAKIKDIGGLQIKRIIDCPNTGVPLERKDAPVDKGEAKFVALFEAAKKASPLWVPEVSPPAHEEEPQEVPLPLEENTSAATESTSAAPTFRNLPIAWENVTTEEDGKSKTEHWIVWGDTRSKREGFFERAFSDKYNKIKKRVKFIGKAADDVLRLTSGQRTKLMYEILAWKYGLEEVSDQDSIDLTWLCQREEDNKTADDLLSRLYWPNGLAKLVTFGVGMKLDGAAQHTWCYSFEYEDDKATFEGKSMSWEDWQV